MKDKFHMNRDKDLLLNWGSNFSRPVLKQVKILNNYSFIWQKRSSNAWINNKKWVSYPTQDLSCIRIVVKSKRRMNAADYISGY